MSFSFLKLPEDFKPQRLREELGGLFPADWREQLTSRLAVLASHKRGVAIAAAVVFFVGVAGCLTGSDSAEKVPKDVPIYVKVRPGMSARAVGDELAAKGIIDSKYKFWLTAKLNGYESEFKTGSYSFTADMEIRDVIAKLVAGETTVIKFTIPEGFGVKDIAERLEVEGLADKGKFMREAKDFAPYDYIEANKDAVYRAEGFLFPDTYTIQADLTEREIMEIMAQDLDSRLNRKLRRRAAEMDLSLYDLITMASLVEKEARYDEDRAIIAQVFFKRLEIGMPLQTDATLQYLMDAPKEDVSIADTEIDSPYNTYQHYGLPPGPIANPGMASIEAVLYPADTDYLYFVADREGHNHYSYSYDEHLRIVDEVR